MDFEKYREDKHAEYLPDYMRPTFAEGEINTFEQPVREAVETVKEITGYSSEELEIVLAVTDEEELEKDAPDDYYFMGYSFHEGMRGYPRNAIFLRASTNIDGWKPMTKNMLAHELGHQVFYQDDVEWEDDQYHSIMFEGHAMNLSQKAGQKEEWDYSPVWRKEEPIELDKEVLYYDLELPRTFGDDEDEVDHNMFVKSGERWQDAEGYIISYQIVRHLIEEDRVSLGSMLNLESIKWREMVQNAVEELY